jgi:hypothetical protein
MANIKGPRLQPMIAHRLGDSPSFRFNLEHGPQGVSWAHYKSMSVVAILHQGQLDTWKVKGHEERNEPSPLL